jgi:nitroreductase
MQMNAQSSDLIEQIRGRRSLGRSEGEPSPKAIRELIDAAVTAPNHHLTQPWSFTVLRGDARAKFGQFWAATKADEMGLQGAQRDGFIAGESQKPLRAPVLIVVSTRTDDDPVVAAEDFAATAAAVENLLLAASARGFAAMWRTGDLAYHPAVRRYLGLESRDRIVAVVYLGERATKDAKPQERSEPNIRWMD